MPLDKYAFWDDNLKPKPKSWFCVSWEASSSVKKVPVSSSSLSKPTLKSALSSESIRAYHSPDPVLSQSQLVVKSVLQIVTWKASVKDSSKYPLQFLNSCLKYPVRTWWYSFKILAW